MNRTELTLDQLEKVSGGDMAGLAFQALLIAWGLITSTEEESAGASGGW